MDNLAIQDAVPGDDGYTRPNAYIRVEGFRFGRLALDKETVMECLVSYYHDAAAAAAGRKPFLQRSWLLRTKQPKGIDPVTRAILTEDTFTPIVGEGSLLLVDASPLRRLYDWLHATQHPNGQKVDSNGQPSPGG